MSSPGKAQAMDVQAGSDPLSPTMQPAGDEDGEVLKDPSDQADGPGMQHVEVQRMSVDDRNAQQAPTLLALMDAGALRSHYQPIVDLETGEAVAYEALIRGPQGSALEFPGALFAAAAAEGLSEALEWAGVACAVEGALAAGMDESLALFINVEGGSVGKEPAGPSVIGDAEGRLRIIFEVTERALLVSPGRLLTGADWLWQRGWGVAIDDVGLEHPEGIAALTLVQPDVVKLDIGLIEGVATGVQASVGLAVRAYVEEYGGVVIAEGIESMAQLERAQVLGASHGQGYLFGRPAPLPDLLPVPSRLLPTPHDPISLGGETPFQIVSRHLQVRKASKRVLLPVSEQLEHRASELGAPVIVFGTFQDRRHMTPRTRRRYEALSAQASLVAAFGADLEANPVGTVRGVALDPEDPLVEEWVVVVIAPHYAAALVARDLGDLAEPDMERRFEYAVTHDRRVVGAIGRSLMGRIGNRDSLS